MHVRPNITYATLSGKVRTTRVLLRMFKGCLHIRTYLVKAQVLLVLLAVQQQAAPASGVPSVFEFGETASDSSERECAPTIHGNVRYNVSTHCWDRRPGLDREGVMSHPTLSQAGRLAGYVVAGRQESGSAGTHRMW